MNDAAISRIYGVGATFPDRASVFQWIRWLAVSLGIGAALGFWFRTSDFRWLTFERAVTYGSLLLVQASCNAAAGAAGMIRAELDRGTLESFLLTPYSRRDFLFGLAWGASARAIYMVVPFVWFLAGWVAARDSVAWGLWFASAGTWSAAGLAAQGAWLGCWLFLRYPAPVGTPYLVALLAALAVAFYPMVCSVGVLLVFGWSAPWEAVLIAVPLLIALLSPCVLRSSLDRLETQFNIRFD